MALSGEIVEILSVGNRVFFPFFFFLSLQLRIGKIFLEDSFTCLLRFVYFV